MALLRKRWGPGRAAAVAISTGAVLLCSQNTSGIFFASSAPASATASSVVDSEIVADMGPNSGSLLDLSFVDVAQDGAIVVDFSNDPTLAGRALTKAGSTVENKTVRVVGMNVVSALEARRQDQLLAKGERAVPPPLCAPEPSGVRSDDGSTAPYFGCDPATGVQSRGDRVFGDADETLPTALALVAQRRLPGFDGVNVTASISGGNAVIDFPAQFSSATSSTEIGDSLELVKSLLFTAYSNGSVASIQFTVTGDCMKFALAVGGDACGTTNFEG